MHYEIALQWMEMEKTLSDKFALYTDFERYKTDFHKQAQYFSNSSKMKEVR